MGRPLRQDTIEAMGLVASGKTLSKQVGYNKYKVKDSEDEIVMLAETENLDSGEVVLSLTDGVKSKPVLKIMKHLFQTSDEAYVYELNAEGKPVFEKEGQSHDWRCRDLRLPHVLQSGSEAGPFRGSK